MQNRWYDKAEKKLLFFGAPLLDISLHCNFETLQKYGLKTDDCIRENNQHENLIRSLLGNPDSQMTAGGSSQNSARICKWVLGDGGQVSFAGCVGKDDYAETMRICLQSEGVEALYITLPGESTGICACLLSSDGDRSMCTRLGAGEHIAASHLQEEIIYGKMRKAHCIFVEGYVFGHSPDIMLAIIETCTDSQLFSISLSAEYVCRDYAVPFMKVLPRVDVLFTNEAEVKVLAQSMNFGNPSSVEEIARELALRDRLPSDRSRIVVITRGPNPVLVAQGNNTILSLPVPCVKVVDGVGCGDAMAGAFLAVYTLSGDIIEATKTGIAAAAEIAQVNGCRPTQKKMYPIG